MAELLLRENAAIEAIDKVCGDACRHLLSGIHNVGSKRTNVAWTWLIERENGVAYRSRAELRRRSRVIVASRCCYRDSRSGM